MLAGEEVEIARYGKAVARIVLCTPEFKPRQFGQDRGRIWIAEDFNQLPEELREFFPARRPYSDCD